MGFGAIKVRPLLGCCFNAQPLAEALIGHTRIKFFRWRSEEGIPDEDVLVLLRALAGNLGIETLDLARIQITDESWNVMCQSLANHSAFDRLDLAHTGGSRRPGSPVTYMAMSEARKTHRTLSLVEMLKVNTTITTISLDPD